MSWLDLSVQSEIFSPALRPEYELVKKNESECDEAKKVQIITLTKKTQFTGAVWLLEIRLIEESLSSGFVYVKSEEFPSCPDC